MRTSYDISNEITKVEIQINLIKKACKKIAVKDMKDYDHVFYDAQRHIDLAEPACIVIREGEPRLESAPLSSINEAAGWTRITLPKLKKLYEFQTKLKELIKERGAAVTTCAQRNRRAAERYVVWNYVIDFDDVPDRDGFLVEVYDGFGKMLLRQIWATMESTDNVNCYCGDDAEELEVGFVKKIASLMMDFDEKIEPEIVFCGKID